jgi:hypothetical protein
MASLARSGKQFVLRSLGCGLCGQASSAVLPVYTLRRMQELRIMLKMVRNIQHRCHRSLRVLSPRFPFLVLGAVRSAYERLSLPCVSHATLRRRRQFTGIGSRGLKLIGPPILRAFPAFYGRRNSWARQAKPQNSMDDAGLKHGSSQYRCEPLNLAPPMLYCRVGVSRPRSLPQALAGTKTHQSRRPRISSGTLSHMSRW